eukprot:SAG11_NODE_1069_length_5978_cov_4.956965_2_plen_273_part_00
MGGGASTSLHARMNRRKIIQAVEDKRLHNEPTETWRSEWDDRAWLVVTRSTCTISQAQAALLSTGGHIWKALDLIADELEDKELTLTGAPKHDGCRTHADLFVLIFCSYSKTVACRFVGPLPLVKGRERESACGCTTSSTCDTMLRGAGKTCTCQGRWTVWCNILLACENHYTLWDCYRFTVWNVPWWYAQEHHRFVAAAMPWKLRWLNLSDYFEQVRELRQLPRGSARRADAMRRSSAARESWGAVRRAMANVKEFDFKDRPDFRNRLFGF